MGTKLYVGNLPFNTTENELQEIFSQAGAVQEVTLMQDRFTGKSRGFAFVTMGSEEEAQNAISKFNGHTMEGRPMTVNEARPREQRPPAHASSAAQATRLLQPPSLLRPLRPTRSMRVDPKESAGSRANRSVMRTL
jgi:RNA recognition motif-containing protein